jgi:hypothetical protein
MAIERRERTGGDFVQMPEKWIEFKSEHFRGVIIEGGGATTIHIREPHGVGICFRYDKAADLMDLLTEMAGEAIDNG